MMRRTITALAVLAALGTVGAAITNAVTTAGAGGSATQSATQGETRTFAVDHMTCGMCLVTVRRAMEGVAGVKAVEIDLDAETATVTYDPAITAPAEIAAASTNAGYPAKPAGPGG